MRNIYFILRKRWCFGRLTCIHNFPYSCFQKASNKIALQYKIMAFKTKHFPIHRNRVGQLYINTVLRQFIIIMIIIFQNFQKTHFLFLPIVILFFSFQVELLIVTLNIAFDQQLQFMRNVSFDYIQYIRGKSNTFCPQ